jgi:hypothetical protein
MNKKVIFNGNEYEFIETKLHFYGKVYTNVFENKNNKTLQETIKHRRYSRLKNDVSAKYSQYLDMKIGTFLRCLKEIKDPFYKNFLNEYGDSYYSSFKIVEDNISRSKGIYLYCVNDVIKYVGKSTDSFVKRINNGYGKIHPKNAFIDGQATNCHINSLITSCKDDVSLFLLALKDDALIDSLEKGLIHEYKPKWNIQCNY